MERTEIGEVSGARLCGFYPGCEWERGELLPSQKPNTMMRYSCGETFDSHDPPGSYIHRGHIYAAQPTDGIRR